MLKDTINKIIYFDKETIRNILQERDRGELLRTTDISSNLQTRGTIATEASAKLKLDVPLIWCATRQVDKLNNENFFLPRYSLCTGLFMQRFLVFVRDCK